MKKLILSAIAITCAASVFAQGTVNFLNRPAGGITYVYLSPASVTSAIQGNGTLESVTGTTDWSAFTRLAGSGYSAVLLSAPGSGQPESSLVAASPVTTFRTGTAAGNWASTTETLANVAKDAAVATAEVAVWDNKGGTVNTWAQAKPLWLAGTLAAGVSGTFDILSIGGDVNTPPTGAPAKSFNIYIVPEPSTMALAGLGAAALLIFRRRK